MQTVGENWCIFEDGRRPGEKTRLLVKECWMPELFRVVKETKVQSIQIKEWTHSNIEFLSAIVPQVRTLTVEGSQSLEDLSAISDLANLEELSVYGPLERVDFTRLKKLRTLSINGSNQEGNWLKCPWITKLNIAQVHVSDLRPLEKLVHLQHLTCGNRALTGLGGIEKLGQLTRLAVGETPWTSLSGVEAAPRLKQLLLSFMPKLVDAGAISQLRKLQLLSIRQCRRFHDLSPIEQLSALKVLDLSDCKLLDSLAPLASLNSLMAFRFSGTGKIEDGNSVQVLQSLPNLRFVAFKAWKHYECSAEDIRQGIARRGVALVEFLNEIEVEG
jgi:Leucine-rich repeat (LRR) protein